jgi:hypothetical protein
MVWFDADGVTIGVGRRSKMEITRSNTDDTDEVTSDGEGGVRGSCDAMSMVRILTLTARRPPFIPLPTGDRTG